MSVRVFADTVLAEQDSDKSLADPGFSVAVLGSAAPGAWARFWDRSGVPAQRLAWIAVDGGAEEDDVPSLARSLGAAVGRHGCREVWIVVEGGDPAFSGSGAAAVGAVTRTCGRVAELPGLPAGLPVVGLLLDEHVGLRKVHELSTQGPPARREAAAATPPSGGIDFRPSYALSAPAGAPLQGLGMPSDSGGGLFGPPSGALFDRGRPDPGSPITAGSSLRGASSWNTPGLGAPAETAFSAWEAKEASAGAAPWEQEGGLRSDPQLPSQEVGAPELSAALAGSVTVMREFVRGLPGSQELKVARDRARTARSAEEPLADLRALVRAHGTGEPPVMDAWGMVDRGLRRMEPLQARAVLRAILGDGSRRG